MMSIPPSLRRRGVTPSFVGRLVFMLMIGLVALATAIWVGATELRSNGSSVYVSDEASSSRALPYQPAQNPSKASRVLWRAEALRPDQPQQAGEGEREEKAANEDVQAGEEAERPEYRMVDPTQYSHQGYDPHCANPQSREHSDLCAQWAAVRLSGDGVDVARSSLAFENGNLLIGVLLGVLTIFGLVIAVRAAELSAYANEDTALAQRAFVNPVVTHDGCVARLALHNFGQTVGIVHRISLKDSGPRRCCPRDEIEVATPVEAGRSIELPLDMRNSGRLRIELEYSDLLGTRYLQRTCHVRLPDGTYYCRQYEEKNPGRLEGELISNYRERIRVTRS